MKNIPNYLTISRIIFAIILLLFFNEVSPVFMVIFTLAMLTDFLDGKIARRLNICSEKGAFLDSIADFLLDSCILKILIRKRVLTKHLSLWLVFALIIGAISTVINCVKHKKLFFIHSLLCKGCMWLLFGVPFAVHFEFIEPYMIIILSLITVSMIELLIMSILLQEPDPNAKSIYSLIKRQKPINT